MWDYVHTGGMRSRGFVEFRLLLTFKYVRGVIIGDTHFVKIICEQKASDHVFKKRHYKPWKHNGFTVHKGCTVKEWCTVHKMFTVHDGFIVHNIFTV